MFKKYTMLTGCIFFATVSAASAAAFTNTNPGDKISITATAATNPGNTFEYQTSPQVKIQGFTTATAFAVSAVHNDALAKTGGMAFGMASDSSDLMWKDVSATGSTLAALTSAVTATAFAGWKTSDGAAIPASP